MIFLLASAAVSCSLLFAAFYPRLTLLEILSASFPVGAALGGAVSLLMSCMTKQIKYGSVFCHNEMEN